MTNTAKLYAPPGTYEGVANGSPFTVEVVPFEASISPAAGAVGTVFEVTGNGPFTAQWFENDVEAVGETGTTFTSTEAGVVSCFCDPEGAHDPVEPTAIVTAPSGFELLLTQVFNSTVTTTTETFVADTSQLQAGDLLIAIVSQGGTATTTTPAVQTFDGVSAPSPVLDLGGLVVGARTARVYAYTMPGAGSGTFPVVIQKDTSNQSNLTLFGVRGGEIASHDYQAFATGTTFDNSVTPSTATNLILSSFQANAGNTTITWTGVTQEATNGSTNRCVAASATNVPAAPLAVRATFPSARSGHLLTLCVEPV